MMNKQEILNNLTNNNKNIIKCKNLKKHYFEKDIHIEIGFDKEKDNYVVSCFKCKNDTFQPKQTLKKYKNILKNKGWIK